MKHIALLFAFAALAAQAQPYPTKPIRMVVPYTAGGPADLLVRALGQKLTEAWGQQVIVENKPGANEIIAAQEVAKSPPDGYNWLLASDAVYSLNTYLYSKLPYDPAKDFAPVARIVTANLMLVARPDFPAANARELIDHAKKNPGKLNYGTVGAGGHAARHRGEIRRRVSEDCADARVPRAANDARLRAGGGDAGRVRRVPEARSRARAEKGAGLGGEARLSGRCARCAVSARCF